MKNLILLLLVISSFTIKAQHFIDAKVGGIFGLYTYSDFNTYLNTYNDGFKDNPDFISPAKFKNKAIGYQFSLGYAFDRFNVDFNVSGVKTGITRAEWKYWDRCFQLKSFLFDMDGGVYLMDELSKFRLSIGAGVTIISTRIQAFTDYGDFRSYGSENLLNGVWTSWKGYGTGILKGTYNLDEENWRIYFTAKFPFSAKKISSVGYAYSAEFTSAGDVFPADNNKPFEYENRLSENFRFINFSLGICYTIEL